MFQGSIPALVTPFTDAGKVDEADARAVLRGAPAPAAAQRAEILEVGFLPADPSRADA